MIRYPPDSGEPVAKRLALMRVERVPEVAVDAVEVFRCGSADGAEPAACAVVPPPG